MGDTDLLRLVQWLSPAFPLGSFAYSHGLEAAVVAGDVHDAASAQAWIGDVVTSGAGLGDAVLLVHAASGKTEIDPLADFARALAPSRERWEESFRQGQALTDTLNALDGTAEPDVAFPVAVGRAARGLDLSPVTVASVYLQAFATTLALAAVRFIPLGQTEGQAIVKALQPVFLDVADAASGMALDDIGTAVPGADLRAMEHETLDVRIFRT